MKIYRCLLILLNAILFINNSLGAGYPEVKELWRTTLPKAATRYYVEAVGEDNSWLLSTYAPEFCAWISSSGVLLDSFDKSPMDDIDVVSVSSTDLSYLIDGSIIQKKVNSSGDVSTLKTKLAGVGRSQFGTATPEKRNPFLVFNGNTIICYRIDSGAGSGGATGSGLSQYIKIKNDPVDQYGILGGSVEFKFDVASSIPVTYQWQKDGKDLVGAALTNLRIDKIAAINGGIYTMIVKSALGSVTSSPAKLDVVSLPIVTFATNRVSGEYGKLTTIAPTIVSQGPTLYRWFKDSILLAGEETQSINIDATSKSGNYSVECRNLAGVALSKTVIFVQNIIPPGAKKWEFLTGGEVDSSPAIGSDGTVYVGSWDGKVYAIASDSLGLAKSPWPKFHSNNQNTGKIASGFGPMTINYSLQSGLNLDIPVSPDFDTILEYSTNLNQWSEQQRFGRQTNVPSIVVPLKMDETKSMEYWRTRNQ